MNKGKIIMLIGRSGIGKTFYINQIKQIFPELSQMKMITTRPRREGEDDSEYEFITPSKYGYDTIENKQRYIENSICRKYKIDMKSFIESRWYDVYQDGCKDTWGYYSINYDFDLHTSMDTQLNKGKSYIINGTLETYKSYKKYFLRNTVVPIYLYTTDLRGILIRSLNRIGNINESEILECCRRFESDTKDYSRINLFESGIPLAENTFDVSKLILSDITKLISKETGILPTNKMNDSKEEDES